jgi:bacterioferritin
MKKENSKTDIMGLLIEAIGRELHVSVLYMLQHAIAAGQQSTKDANMPSTLQGTFVASHVPYFLPGDRLKKIAITEMRHAEAITERVVILGGSPPSQPAALHIGLTIEAMLMDDQDQERQAIELYKEIIEIARKANDLITMNLFQRILKDEEGHHRVFSKLLG